MKDQKSYRFELLKFELDAIQMGIDTYNRTIFAVKGLAMTLFTAFIAFLGNETVRSHPVVFIAMACVAAVLGFGCDVQEYPESLYFTRVGNRAGDKKARLLPAPGRA